MSNSYFPENPGSSTVGLAAEANAEALSATEDLYEANRDLAREALVSGRVHLEQAASDFRRAASTKCRDLESDAGEYVRANPLPAVGIAAGIGFLAGLILRR